jgi:hypothetical protein
MHREAGCEPDYFATYNWVDEWTAGGQTALFSFWARPLHAMTDAFAAAGFRITVISDRRPRRIPPANCSLTASRTGGASCASCFSSCRPANLQTVLRAYAELRDEHLVEVRRGRGVTVLAPPDQARLTYHARGFIEAARDVGLSDPEIHDLVRSYL